MKKNKKKYTLNVQKIIILLLILVSTYFGYKKGLVSLAVSFVAFIAAIIITVLL